jgi:CheY-like chemotaxis protein
MRMPRAARRAILVQFYSNKIISMGAGKMARRILVVDDNIEAGELLQMLLETQGYEVRIASDGLAGLTEAGLFRPHVVCTDIEMPGLNGRQLAKALRESPHSADAMIIAITGWSSNQIDADVSAGGFDLHLMKPFSIEAICGPLEEYFRSIEGSSN